MEWKQISLRIVFLSSTTKWRWIFLKLPYVVFDVETTGLSAIYNDLIQVAASKMYKGNIIAEFDEFINPGHPLSAFTTELTGITDDHVKNAKPLVQVLKEFQEFCKDTVLVAHNASFDVGFMNANYERHGLPKLLSLSSIR